MSTTWTPPTQEQLQLLVRQRDQLQELVQFAMNKLDAKSWTGILLDMSDQEAKEIPEEHWIDWMARELNAVGYKVDPAKFHELRNPPAKKKKGKK